MVALISTFMCAILALEKMLTMLTKAQLIKRVQKVLHNTWLGALAEHSPGGFPKIKKSIPFHELAQIVAKQTVLNLKTTLPPCFGVLYDKTAFCNECKINEYCEIVVVRVPHKGNIIAEQDLLESAPFGFREGSRAAMLIKAWKSNLLMKGELKTLSTKLFDSVIDIDRIIAEIQKRRLLIHDGKYFGIRRPSA